MPELPEVYTITKDLRKTIKEWKIGDIKLIEGKYLDNIDTQKLIGAEIVEIEQIAKNIAIHLDNDHTLIIHLIMTGQLLLRSPTYKGKDKYLKLRFELEKEDKKIHLKLSDKRGWAKVKLLKKDQLPKFKQKYGINPLKEEINPKMFKDSIQKRDTAIKNALLDQKLISGVGNAYAIESLFMAKINPNLKTSKLTDKQAKDLLNSLQKVLKEGIENRGLSISDYVDIFGKKGKQQDFLRVYLQEKCPECETEIETVKIGGRTTYFCPQCQK